jgi:hypothetical protein
MKIALDHKEAEDFRDFPTADAYVAARFGKVRFVKGCDWWVNPEGLVVASVV